MGIMGFMEKKVQQRLLKSSMEAAWIASTCIGMVFGPLLLAMEMGSVRKARNSDVNEFIKNWLGAWEEVRHLSDRSLQTSRDDYQIRPDERLSPILSRFESKLRSIQFSDSSGPLEMLAAVKEAYEDTAKELMDFRDWIKSSGPNIGFNATEHENSAVAKAQKYWAQTLRSAWVG